MPDKAGKVVFVGNIPYEEQIVRLFSQCGQVLNFRLVYDKDTGRPKGYGFAEFSDADAAASAVRNLNGHEVMNRTLKVDYSSEAGPGPVPGPAPASTDAQHQLQQNLSQQQHYQQFQQQHLQQQRHQVDGPVGVDLPDNVSAPDAISRTLSAMDPKQLLDVISQMKDLVALEPQRVQQLLANRPQVAYAIFQALLLMGLVDTATLSQVVEAPPAYPQPVPQPPQQSSFQYPPPPVQYPGYPAHPTPMQQQYQPPAPSKPANLSDQQWDSIRQLCSIPQQAVDSISNPAERSSITAIRQQYMAYFV